MKITDKQLEELKKVHSNAIRVGFGHFSLSTFYDKSEKDIIIEIIYVDNFFERKPNTYLVNVGSDIYNMKSVQEKICLPFDDLVKIVEDF